MPIIISIISDAFMCSKDMKRKRKDFQPFVELILLMRESRPAWLHEIMDVVVVGGKSCGRKADRNWP